MLAQSLATLMIVTPLAVVKPAFAQEKPAAAAPASTAPFEVRDNWCQQYAAWFVEQMPKGEAMPADVRPTHRIETEVQFCNLDPQQYERQTVAELTGTTRAG